MKKGGSFTSLGHSNFHEEDGGHDMKMEAMIKKHFGIV